MSDSNLGSPPPAQLTAVHWLILAIAALGFAFDIYELLMMQFVLRPAIEELSGATLGSPTFDNWRQLLFFVPMLMGGLVGLVGGYLTDYLGRRRMLVWSILLYAFSAFFAGFSTSLEMLLVLRCLTLIGVCIEFVAAVAWLAELFTDQKQRETMLGYSQAFSSVGGLLAAVVWGILVVNAPNLPAVAIPGFLTGVFGQISEAGQHSAWRYMLMSGVLPALPLIIVRPFLPESPIWAKRRREGTLKRPSFAAIFQGDLRRTTLITTAMVACGYGVALGCIQQIPQIVPGVPQVVEKVKAAQAITQAKLDALKARGLPEAETRDEETKLKRALAKTASEQVQPIVSSVGTTQEIGGLVGRFLLAYLAVLIFSRRRLFWVFVVPGLLISPLVFGYAAVNDLNWLYVGIFLVGMFTVGQFSFWGNYLPVAYPVHLRGTGESFAANVGGRILGTSAVLLTTQLQLLFEGLPPPTKLAYAAALVALLLYTINLILSFFLPEPAHRKEE
jgi:MFS family permease